MREAISGLVNLTLYDNNANPLESKGSGIQRIVLLALMKHIGTKSEKTCIWGIDEPEAFLHPGLQKAVFSEFKTLAKDMPILITTHSPHFIELSDLDRTYLFEASREIKKYSRRPNQVFIKADTMINSKDGAEKVEAIRYNFGIESNDSWHILPFNVLVEGNEDKDYLIMLAKKFNLQSPNILVAGGVDKFPAYLDFLGDFCKEIKFRPKILCLFDHDQEGKSIFSRLSAKQQRHQLYQLETKYVSRSDGRTEEYLQFEIEDWLYPDIVFGGTNIILREKGYRILTKQDQLSRTSKVHRDQNILKFLTEKVATRNTNMPRLDFETLSLKLLLCKKIEEFLKKASDDDFSKWDEQNSSTKRMLEEILALGR